MLYKKIHRQYFREFRIGRRFKYEGNGVVCEVTKKLYIDNENYIMVSSIGDCYEFTFSLISVNSFSTGRFLYKNEFK